MKKKILIIAAVIICITTGYASAEMNNPVYEVFTKTVTVNGKTESGKQNRAISVNVMNPEKDGARTLQYADSAVTGENGNYEFSFKLHTDSENYGGEYVVSVGGYDYETAETKTIYIAGTDEIKEIFNNINTKSENELAAVIADYMKKLNINFELCGKVESSSLAYVVKNEAIKESFDAEKLDDAYARLKCAAVTAAYNEGKQDFLINGSNMIYSKLLGLDNLDEGGVTLYSVYKAVVSEEGKKAVNQALLKKNFKDSQSLKEEFLIQVMLKAIQYPAEGGIEYVSKVITAENAKAVGLSADKYLNSSSKSDINSKIARKAYSSVSALESAIVPNSGTGGSSSRNNSGGSIMPIGNNTAIAGGENNQQNTSLSMFNDIPADYWLYKELYEMKEMEIISGDTNNNFNPDSPIKREEFAKMICNAFNLKMQDKSVEFTDVPSGAWYEPYVKIAASNGVVNGYENGSFGVGQNITRQDICVMVFRALKTENEDPDLAVFKFKDTEDISEYAGAAINYMYVKKIITGFEDYTFRPREECTRVHAVKILHKVLNRAKGIETVAEK